jgi:hypothetical protein
MDPLRATTPIPGALTVGERQAGRRQGDAFRRALQQDGTGGDAAAARDERPMRRPLQPAAPTGRKDDGARHVDVIA